VPSPLLSRWRYQAVLGRRVRLDRLKLIALASCCRLFTVGLMGTVAAVCVPTLTVTVCPWVRSWPAGIPVGSKNAACACRAGIDAGRNHGARDLDSCLSSTAGYPGLGLRSEGCGQPRPELLMALISPAAVLRNWWRRPP